MLFYFCDAWALCAAECLELSWPTYLVRRSCCNSRVKFTEQIMFLVCVNIHKILFLSENKIEMINMYVNYEMTIIQIMTCIKSLWALIMWGNSKREQTTGHFLINKWRPALLLSTIVNCFGLCVRLCAHLLMNMSIWKACDIFINTHDKCDVKGVRIAATVYNNVNNNFSWGKIKTEFQYDRL